MVYKNLNNLGPVAHQAYHQWVYPNAQLSLSHDQLVKFHNSSSWDHLQPGFVCMHKCVHTYTKHILACETQLAISTSTGLPTPVLKSTCMYAHTCMCVHSTYVCVIIIIITRGTYNQVQLPRGSLLIGYVQTVHAWPAQDGKDVQTNNSTILDKGRCRKSCYQPRVSMARPL